MAAQHLYGSRESPAGSGAPPQDDMNVVRALTAGWMLVVTAPTATEAVNARPANHLTPAISIEVRASA